MKIQVTLLGIFFTGFTFANSSFSKITKQEYVNQWSGVAIEQMMLHNIPASITLAQGILESGSGNSLLARKGNNHFGIKCHGWEGKKIYKDDDSKDECFRAYRNAKESYHDHSEFLTKYSRYAFLFEYESTDYKAWAKGLKKAGYATNPKYPQLLIGIIEDLNLDKYDQFSNPEIEIKPSIAKNEKVKTKEEKSVVFKQNKMRSNKHQVYIHKNGVKYIIAMKGDTFVTIANEFGMNLSQLYKYNDFDKHKDFLVAGDIVYIKPKKRAKLFKKEQVVVEKDVSVIEFSQINALNLKSLMRLNKITDNNAIFASGEKVTLR